MKITVITVAYNAAATLGDTLRSVAAQSHPDIEHLVIDGASTDDTARVFDANAGPRSQLFSAPDAGLYDAMNKGVARATGDLIGFLNADDFFRRTDAVARIAAAATGADAVSGGVAIVDAHDAARLTRNYPARPFAPWMLRFGHMPPHPGFYVRRAVFAAVGPFDTTLRIGADFEWMLRFYHGHRRHARAIPETLVSLREGGLSNSGFGSRRRINAEALASLKRHGFRSAAPLVWAKYAVKALQFVTRPADWPPPPGIGFDPRLTPHGGTATPKQGHGEAQALDANSIVVAARSQ